MPSELLLALGVIPSMLFVSLVLTTFYGFTVLWQPGAAQIPKRCLGTFRAVVSDQNLHFSAHGFLSRCFCVRNFRSCTDYRTARLVTAYGRAAIFLGH
jgi:hypothetical protein